MSPDSDATGFPQVFRDEVACIRGTLDVEQALADRKLTALCLSGGGIRSAAFSLGVIQGLATRGLLDRFDYLSTVSGGGYTGAWLTAWRQRAPDGLATLLARLTGPVSDLSDKNTTDPLLNLRRRTNYLTPRAGVLSPDTWTAIALYLRNVFLLNLLIVPLVVAALLALKIVYLRFAVAPVAFLATPAPAVALAVFGWALLATGRPSWTQRPSDGTIAEAVYRGYLRSGTAVLVVAALLFGCALATPEARALVKTDPYAFGPALSTGAGMGILAVLLGLILSRASSIHDPNRGRIVSQDWRWSALVTAAAAIAATVGAAALVALVRALRAVATHASLAPAAALSPKSPPAHPLCCTFVDSGTATLTLSVDPSLSTRPLVPTDASIAPALALVLGPLAFLLAYALAESLYLGLTTRKLRIPEPGWNDRWGDEEREWVARVVGYLAFLGVMAAALYAAAIFSFDAIKAIAGENVEDWKKIGALLGAIGAALGSVGLGASSLTGPKAPESGSKSAVSLRTILLVATPVFLAILLALVSTAIDKVLFGASVRHAADLLAQGQAVKAFQPFKHVLELHPLRWYGALALGCIGLSAVLAWFVNINRYSLHDLYRMRLTREFLGASNKDRMGDPWTGFDASDDVKLWQAALQPEDIPAAGAPGHALFPVINATLNTLRENDLGWGYRKGRSFVFTPHYCGACEVGFRRTEQYGEGIRLGSAMAISGAAVSPNAGYNTMKGVSFLLTLFNVRLGVWSGNPSRESWQERGPRYALVPLADEALMTTSAESNYVYLSDGGHFDNLGLFEMLRRRCEYIVVVDASADPDFDFSDLGEAVRRARLELDVSIRISTAALKNRPNPPQAGPRCAVGEIDYPPTADYPGTAPAKGWLLYLKSAFQGPNEPADVRAFAVSNPLFPHDPTTDQFFDETRFESYRALGEWLVGAIAPADTPRGSLQGFIQAAADYAAKLEAAKAAPTATA